MMENRKRERERKSKHDSEIAEHKEPRLEKKDEQVIEEGKREAQLK